MTARKTTSNISASSVARSPLGIEIYRPTRLDSVCKYTVGSFIAAGAAFAAINLSASSASADEFGGALPDSSSGSFSLSDIALGSGGVSDFSTFTPTLPEFTSPTSAPDVFQAAAPVPDQTFDLVPVPDILQISAPAPGESAFMPAGELSFTTPDLFTEVPVSTGASSTAAGLEAPAAPGLASDQGELNIAPPELTLGLTDLQPTDGTIDPIDPTGVVPDGQGLLALLNGDPAVTLAGADPVTIPEASFVFGAGTVDSVDVFGLPNGVVLNDAGLLARLDDNAPLEETLVASAGDLSGLGITFLADSRAQNDGSKPPVYVPRSDGMPEGSPPQPGGTPVEIYVPPPVSSVIPTTPGSPSRQAPEMGNQLPDTPADVASDEEAATFNWGPAIFTGVGIPFGAYGKTVAGISQGLEPSVAFKDALVRAPISILTDLGLRTALANPISISENEGVNRMFTAGLGGAVAAGVDVGVTKYINPFASEVAERKVNAASGLYPGTLAVLPVVETALQVGANEIEKAFGVCTPGSTDLATYACNSAIGTAITTTTWAGGIAEDLKRQETARITQENIDCGCSTDGALTPEQKQQIQTNYTKVLRNVGIAVGTQSGITALIGAPWEAKSELTTENCSTTEGVNVNCFPAANGVPPAVGGDSNGTPPAVPPTSGGGAVKVDGAVDANSNPGIVPACATVCKADYETVQAPNMMSGISWSPIKAPAPDFGSLAPDISWSSVKAPSPDFGTPPTIDLMWSTVKAPPANFGSPIPDTISWSNVKAPTTPFVVDSSAPKFGESVPQPATVAPGVAVPPAPVQPQQRTTPDAGTAPLDPFINVPLDAAGQGLKWIFDSGVWGAVKVGEIGGSVISPFFGGWSTQP
ncbi:hypothetical protein [Salinibacterium sp.]|uniref:hypothetical protein n=1 Tax=Salinibacterium sp. TaxID=1915057 RepID=UPI00286B183E|nr:hypothetical protein [Salinibacterium sp.]